MNTQSTHARLFRWLTLVLAACLLLAPLPAQRPAAKPAVSKTAISQTQAVAAAVNRLDATAQGYTLRNPAHRADFTPDGVTFTPQRGGPQWTWRLEQVNGTAIPVEAVQPHSPKDGLVTYSRGPIVEQYLAMNNSIEQQFILHQPPAGGIDLVIRGVVESSGAFQTTQQGWEWRTEEGAVTLGQVHVFDARGREIPASMQATASSTRIAVDGAALAVAAYPVTVDPEIGADDFRISDMGSDTFYDAHDPDAAYNPITNQYLVVWHGDTNTGGAVDGELEIWGQLVDAENGWLVGDAFRISTMGPDGDPNHDAYAPAVVCNTHNGEYLVVWEGDDAVDEESEIYGQRLASDGTEIGADDFRISHMGPDGDTAYDAYYPDVAFSTVNGNYGVVWYGDTNAGGLANNELEVWGRGVAGNGMLGANIRISTMGPNGDPNYSGSYPAITYDGVNNNYLVVWIGRHSLPPATGEVEIYGELINAATGATIKQDFLISRMGPNGDTAFAAYDPDAAFNSTTGQFLVVWTGEQTTDNEWEIWGQLLEADGSEVGTDFQISDAGAPGDTAPASYYPKITYNPAVNEYLVIWVADPDVDNKIEVYGQRLDAAGVQIGEDDFRISHMGPEGNADFDADEPSIVYASGPGQYLVVWLADDDRPPMVDNEYEIFGQRLDTAGAVIGEGHTRISFMGADHEFDAQMPAVAYNSQENQYLVVWYGDDAVDGEMEIWGQLIDAATGAEIGGDFAISTTGAPGDPARGAFYPAVAYSSSANQFLVVWHSDHDVNNEFEIYGHYIDGATGQELGDDFRISHMGPDGNTSYRAIYPHIAYNSAEHEFLVVWEGDTDAAGLVDEEIEIWAQRVGNISGSGLLGAAKRVSNVGPDGNTTFEASRPAVVYNEGQNRYLVVWYGDNNLNGCVNDELEIWGQHLDELGDEIDSDFVISAMGGYGNILSFAMEPALAYNSAAGHYLIIWHGSTLDAPAPDEMEIYGRIINAASGETVTPDFRISSVGPDGDLGFIGAFPDAAFDPASNTYLVVWFGDDAADDKYDIYGQHLNANGDLVGEEGFPLSSMGSPLCGTSCGARDPAIAYASGENEFLVVWYGVDDTPPLVEHELEIFGQRYATPASLSGRIFLPMTVRAH